MQYHSRLLGVQVIGKTGCFVVFGGFRSMGCPRIGLRRYLAADLLDKQ
jgi:hypothetical protein